MTHDQFKQAVDTLDTGPGQRPDLADIRARGRSVRRRRRAVAAAGGLAAAAVVAVPILVSAVGGPADEARVAESSSASPSPTPTASATPTDVRAAYADQSDRMTAAVKDVFPQARRTSDDFYDSLVAVDGGMVDTALGDPVTWDHVFRWNQVFDVGDLALFSVSTSWNEPTPGLDWCSSGSFELESGCTTTRLDGGHLLVLHDGVRVQGQDDGVWSRYAQLVSPPSDAGLVQQVDVWATESDMTWAEAQQALPSLEDLGTIAQDERMRLPEPVALPEMPQ